MPVILAAFGYEIVGGITISAGSTVVATISYATLINAAIVAGSVAYSSAQNRKLQNQLKGLGADRGRDIMARDPLAYRRLIYGQVRTTGPVPFMGTQGTKNENLHFIVMIAAHECDELGEITFDNGESVPLDGSGNATGKYAGYVTVKKFVGTASQAASTELIAAFPSIWTSNHKLSGIAYIHVKLKYNVDLFPNGIPTVKCLTKGKKVFDSRDGTQSSGTPSTWKWSPNSALCTADFLHDSTFGRGIAWSRIKTADLVEAANVCDEPIIRGDSFTVVCDVASGNRHIGAVITGILPGMQVGGTGIPSGSRVVSVNSSTGDFFTIDKDPTATNVAVTLTFGDFENRYETHGTITTDQLLDTTTNELAGAMAGHAIDSGGLWTIRAGAYRTPTVDLTDDDLAGSFTVIPRLSRRETYNGVKGTYISPYNQWVASDFPSIKNDTYKGWDGGIRLWKDIALPFTTSPAMAQRLAKIDLERGRQQITVEATYKLKAFECMPIDTVRITRAELGWTNKEFEITNWKFIQIPSDTGIALGVTMNLRETAAAVWDWADGEETTVDLAANTDFDDPSIVPTPTGLTLTSDTITMDAAGDGATIPRIRVEWDTPDNAYIEQGGYVDVEYRVTGDPDWKIWERVRGDSLLSEITGLVIDESYDVRIRFVNQLQVRGAYADDTVVVTGDTTAPATPTGLVATAGTGKAISLDWTDNTERDLSEYRIYRNTSNSFGGATLIAEVSASRFVDVDVAYSTLYYYWITAVDRSENESGNSTEAHATTGPVGSGSVDTTPATDPSAPTLNTNGTYITSDGAVKSRLIINIPSMPSDAVIMNLLYRRNGSTGWLVANQMTTGGSTSAIDDLSPGTSYDVAIQAFTPYGYGSNVVAATGSPFTAPSDTSAPSTPTGLAVVTGTGKSVSLDWDDSTNADFSEYGVYRNTTNTPSTATKIAETRASRFVDVDVTIGTAYYYWITAFDRSENESAKSTVASGTPGAVAASATDSTAPGTPSASSKTSQGTYLAGDGTTFAYLDISVPALPSLAKYQNLLYKKTSGGGDWLIAAQLTNTGTQTVRIDDLVPGISYDVAVIAFTAFAIASSITTATSSPFAAPNKATAAGVPSSTSLVGPASTGIPPVYLGTTVLFAVQVRWTHPTDTDAKYIEVKATATDSDAATDYTWFGDIGVTGIMRVPVSATPACNLYNGTNQVGYVRIRSVDFTGNASSWVSVGNANGSSGVPAGNAGTKSVGTTSGTVAAGDDSRITGAAQKASNLSDLSSSSTARSNLGLGSIATQASSSVSISGGTIDTITSNGIVYSGVTHSGTSRFAFGYDGTNWGIWIDGNLRHVEACNN